MKISAPLLVALHLVPGLLFGGFFFVLSWIFIQCGLTAYLALLITIPLCLVPMELGVMLFWRARFAERKSLSEATGYHQKGTVADYVVLPPLLFLCWSVLSIAVSPISQYFGTHLTAALPAWATQEALIEGFASCSPTQRSISLCLAVLLSGFVAPIVEELYFRGFLLSRMEHWGWMAPAVNSFLFAVYHFYFPENVPGVFVAFISISYVAMVKRNWRIGVVVHSMFNLWGVYSVATLLT